MGLKVHICHTGDYDDNLLKIKAKFEKLGCIYHKPRDWQSLEGLNVISYCNGQFLENLPEIKKFAKNTIFVNCMTWNFPKEIEMQNRGLIDFHLYQTQHAYEKVSPKLAGDNYHPLFYKPYFDNSEFQFNDNRPTDAFRFGRISRADPGKFNSSQLWIYETMTAPVPKAGLIIGWNDKIKDKFKRIPESYIAVVPECWMPQKDFYKFCDAIIMTTDTFENLPRVGFEAMASGSLLIVDNRGGWKLQVEDGETGWLCDNEREFVYKASRAAFEINERDDMRNKAYDKLNNEWGLEASMKSWEEIFKKLISC